jgi:O-antigen/teichoic acid export membrane protein
MIEKWGDMADLTALESASLEHAPQLAAPVRSPMAIIARNSAFVLGVQAVLKILAFLFNVYVVRRLGDVYFGQYSAVMAYVAMFAIFTDWGMSPYAVREMAQNRTQTSWLLPNIIAIRILFSLLIIIIAPLSAMWVGKEHGMVLGVLIASAGLILYAFQGPLDSALTARERLDYTSVFTLVHQLVFWGLGVLLLINGLGFIGLLIASLAGVAVVAVLSGWTLFRLGIGRLTFSVQRWPQLFLAALPFGVSGIANVFAQRFDTVLISFVLSDAAVGWYNVPGTLIGPALLIAQSIAIAMYPSMVRSYAEQPESLPRVVWQAIKYLLIVCLPIMVGGTVLADRIIITLYEETFVNSIPVLQMMLWTLPGLFLLELLGRVTSTMHLERPAARLSVINGAVTVVLNLILVPTLGVLGAALAAVSSVTIRLVQFWRLVGSEYLVGQRWGSLLRLALATTTMGVIVFLLRQVPLFGAIDSRVGLLALIGAGAIVYVAALLALGGVERQELAFLHRMVMERLARGGTK